jgi:hypothetical protein
MPRSVVFEGMVMVPYTSGISMVVQVLAFIFGILAQSIGYFRLTFLEVLLDTFVLDKMKTSTMANDC